jgi:uncharacterized membrane protein
MDPVSLTLALSYTLGGLLIVALAIPLVQGRVKRNALYGIRLPQSLKSDNAWLAINRFGGKSLIAWSTIMILAGVACFFIPLQSNTALTIAIGFVPFVCIGGSLIQTWRFARSYAARSSSH